MLLKKEQEEMKVVKKAMKMEIPVLSLGKGKGVSGQQQDDRPISSISNTNMQQESMFSNDMKSHRSGANDSTNNKDLGELLKATDSDARKRESSTDAKVPMSDRSKRYGGQKTVAEGLMKPVRQQRVQGRYPRVGS